MRNDDRHQRVLFWSCVVAVMVAFAIAAACTARLDMALHSGQKSRPIS